MGAAAQFPSAAVESWPIEANLPPLLTISMECVPRRKNSMGLTPFFTELIQTHSVGA
jgi:hypothetical protein